MINAVFGSNPFFGRAFGMAGSATAPTYSFFGDPDTGFFTDGANAVSLSLGGTRWFTFTTGSRIYGTNQSPYIELGGSGPGNINLVAGGTNQSITLTPSGNGTLVVGSSAFAKFGSATNNIFGLDIAGTAYGPLIIQPGSGQPILCGTATDSGNGKIQLATHTTSAGGIGFGTALALYRNAAGELESNVGFNNLGFIKSTSATAGVGYGTGAGGTVAQATSKATGVTLSKVCGTITMNAANLAADTSVSFVLTNTAIAATDLVVVQHSSAGTLGAYDFAVTPAAGSATITVRNQTPGALAEAIVLRFAVIKAVTS
jgi:hypothetical protein